MFYRHNPTDAAFCSLLESYQGDESLGSLSQARLPKTFVAVQSTSVVEPCVQSSSSIVIILIQKRMRSFVPSPTFYEKQQLAVTTNNPTDWRVESFIENKIVVFY